MLRLSRGLSLLLLLLFSALPLQPVAGQAIYRWFPGQIVPAQAATDVATTLTIHIPDVTLSEAPVVAVVTCPDTVPLDAPTEMNLGDVRLIDPQTISATLPAGMGEGIYQIRLAAVAGEIWFLDETLTIKRPADGQPGPWQIVPPQVELERYSASAVAAQNWLYSVGGEFYNGTSASVPVKAAPILADGSLGAWQTQPDLLTPRRDLALIAAGGYLYAIGGQSVLTAWFTPLATVERAPLLSGGGIGAWEQVAPLPVARTAAAAVLVGERVFVMGGIIADDLHNSAFAADLLPNGDLGPWKDVTPPPVRQEQIIRGTIAVAADDAIYLLGGGDAAVHRSRVQADGSLEAWQAVRSSLVGHNGGGAAVIDNTIYAMSGFYGCIYGSNLVERATINPDGSLSEWVPAASTNLGHGGGAFAVWGDTLYALGGMNGASSGASGVEYARVSALAPAHISTIWLPLLLE